MQKIKTIIFKEWAEVFKNRMVIFSVLFMPLLFTALPLIILFLTSQAGISDVSTDMPAQFGQMCPPSLTTGECFQVYIASQFTLLFLMMPLIIPVNIAAYSIVGEKTTHSLEPLLATPITTAELLTGKNLAALLPALAATWAGFLIYSLGVILISSTKIAAALLSPIWLVAIFVLGPLLALLSVNFSLMISSRVNDPRAAEQISSVVILPVLVLFIGQISGMFLISLSMVWLISLAVAALDALMIYLAVQVFQRETILTRWK
ncbi:MAG: ABC transporter permease subunit [Anaerolineales bacterium]|jgi:ABC-2 type transport system permease protein|nr:ABC transporter permease subunit [Anaerolineales bacterium]